LDEQVPHAVAVALRLRGVDVLTVQEDRHAGSPDYEVLNRAHQLGRVLFTLDSHFHGEASRRQREGHSFSGVVYAHQPDCTLGQMVRDLELLAKAGMPEEYENRVQFIPL